jgi:type I restriction enzyme S subunit
MQHYESHKPSGVEWLGEIPSHWQLKKNKYLFSECKEVVGKDVSKFKLLSLTLQGVILRDMENPKGKFPAEFNTYKKVSPDDLIFCLFDIEETPRTVGRAMHQGMITGAYTVARCYPDVSSSFLYYYYLSLDQEKRLRPLYTGLRNVITKDKFFGLTTPLPPQAEQDRIVNFLDQKTAEIDAAIAKKQRLIELLQEQKSILINQAVTRGLNPNVAMRDSGLELIGKIPAHWEVKPLKRLVTFTGGGTPNKNTLAFWNGEIPWVSPKDMKYEEISRSQDTITELGLRKSSAKLILANSILVVVRGMILARTFPVGINTVPVTINQDMKALTPRAEVDPAYLMYLLAGMGSHVLDLTEESGHGTKTLPTEKLGSFLLVFPPVGEQIAIRNFCKQITEQVDEVIAAAQKQLVQLSELKSTVITAATSGKIQI